MTDYYPTGYDSVDHTDKATLIELYHEHQLSINDIADLADVDYNTVHYWMEKHGIERRDKVSEVVERNKKTHAHYRTNKKGRTYWRSYNPDGPDDHVLVYRLLAVAEYGFEEIRNKDIHHKIPIPWLNTPDNIIPMDPSEHQKHHGRGY